jgi:hypothetical protein
MVAGSPRTWATNDYVTATGLNNELRDQLLARSGAPRAYIWKSKIVTYPPSAGVGGINLGWDQNIFAVNLDQVLYDYSFDGTAMAQGDGRLFVNRSGMYRLNAAAVWSKQASGSGDTGFNPQLGTRAVYIGKNMNGTFQTNPAVAGIDSVFATQLDYFECIADSSNQDTIPPVARVRGSMRANQGDHFQLFARMDAVPLDLIASQGTVFLQAQWMSN